MVKDYPPRFLTDSLLRAQYDASGEILALHIRLLHEVDTAKSTIGLLKLNQLQPTAP
jgi:hypothetical protein